VPLAEAAQWASVSKKTLWRYIGQGLRAHQAKPGSKVLVRLEDIREFLKPRQAKSVNLGKLVDEVIAKVRG
jgi:predicted site-specific integrase-resolvase